MGSTWFDKETELTWMTTSEELNFNEAVKYVDEINTTEPSDGYNNWRLPSLEELKTIAIDNELNLSGFYWSCTLYTAYDNSHYGIDFDIPEKYGRNDCNRGKVILVRTFE